MTTLELDVTDGRRLRFVTSRLFIAGFTGRDQSVVDAHIEELRELGVPVPAVTPTLMQVSASLLTTAAEIGVAGRFTSGEVEAVLLNVDGELFVAAGSDHTDRDLETVEIALSKEACPKVLSAVVAPVAGIGDWDAIVGRSWVDDEDAPYQDGLLGDLIAVRQVMELFERESVRLLPGDAVFLGTFPVRGGLRPTPRFTAVLELPEGSVLRLSYAVKETK